MKQRAGVLKRLFLNCQTSNKTDKEKRHAQNQK